MFFVNFFVVSDESGHITVNKICAEASNRLLGVPKCYKHSLCAVQRCSENGFLNLDSGNQKFLVKKVLAKNSKNRNKVIRKLKNENFRLKTQCKKFRKFPRFYNFLRNRKFLAKKRSEFGNQVSNVSDLLHRCSLSKFERKKSPKI